MDDLIEDAGPGNAPEFTVSEISGAVKRAIESGFSHVRVRGEVGRLSMPRSGHVYLDLKDDRSVLAAVIWKGTATRLAHPPEEGMEVIATGRLTTFPGQSKYQLVIEDLRPAGAGALMAMLEKRRAMLAAEGLFDAGRKKRLPFLPEVIGVVTSPSGAVIRDILHRLRDRFPRRVLIWPVAVQGANCAPEVARAIRGFNALPEGGRIPRPDLLIVARGGGSLEDLWGFNEEIVVRAAADSAIPLISAVGHETDTTLIDHAADWRAPTPTAAAEKAVPVRLDLLNWLRTQDGILTRGMTQALDRRRQRLADLSRALPRPESLLDQARQRLDLAAAGLAPALRHRAATARGRLDGAAARLAPALDRAVGRKRLALGQGAARLSPAALQGLVRQGRRDLAALDRRLDPARQQRRLADARARLDDLSARFARVAETGLAARRDRLAALDRLHQTLGYTETLRRGYAVVRAGEAVLTRKTEAETHAALEIEFADGKLAVTPTGATPRPAPKRQSGPSEPGQGSLF
ncbi:exodeoxyribonuclease VII large subunit [Roseicyclus persicicus]|uniref:Exodeoxyribonuclease 7 large subunit n=1 Tax=Roseicyclus persicicus TaxID=2650661 RepID=A0A7X6JYN9_9RHOB|nr:exodeoxyribonuclease VII large subunit [Roseibacterium persicicum]NKX44305.1 exodeoxyribonuclease VII large subunit [Roseibacterium persicicum]